MLYTQTLNPKPHKQKRMNTRHADTWVIIMLLLQIAPAATRRLRAIAALFKDPFRRLAICRDVLVF